MALNTIFRRMWEKKDGTQITSFLTESEVKKHISDVNQMRKDYLRSEEYAKQLYDISAQNLNLKGNHIKTETIPGTDAVLEYMSLYQKVLDIHPEAFKGRDTQKIKKSLQRSIYSSAQSVLSKNFIHQLIPNHPDSFLIFPIGFSYRDKENKLIEHGGTFIVRKKDSKIIVETLDKAAMRAFYPDKEAISLRLPDKVSHSYKNQESTFNYTYEIKDTKENIFALTEALRIGRVHLHKGEEKNIGLYAPYNRISKIAEKEYYTNHIAKGQYVQNNCMIKNLTGALQYLFGTPRETTYKLADGTKAVKMKYDGLTKEQINSTMQIVMIDHLKKLGHRTSIKTLMVQDFLRYKEMKIERSELEGLAKAEKKQQKGKILDQEYNKMINAYKTRKPSPVKSINYDYGKKTKRSLLPNFKKKEDLNRLTKDELKKIIIKSQELNESKIDKNYNKLFKMTKEAHTVRS
jgi:hypothetical protein